MWRKRPSRPPARTCAASAWRPCVPGWPCWGWPSTRPPTRPPCGACCAPRKGRGAGLPGPARDALLAGLAGGAGLLGGLHFGLAVRVLAADQGVDPGRGGRLYALDLAGAALFLLPATLAGFPLLGFTGALVAAAAPGVAGLVALLWSLRREE